jgi:hypothetical protein
VSSCATACSVAVVALFLYGILGYVVRFHTSKPATLT